MSMYTTPLQFGYFLALLFAILFWVRGVREERLSDTLLGWIMLLLNQDLQDYTFGFAGINVLWEELNGFPRGVGLLFGPAIYFYLRAQTNRNFRFKRSHLWHLAPWAITFLWELSFFIRGPEVIQRYQESTLSEVMSWVGTIMYFASWIYYFTLSIRLYRNYRSWIASQFSDLETVKFSWFRNFIYVFIAGFVFKQSMMTVDSFLDLEFYQDFWWNYGLVAIVIYVAIKGYTQPQMVPITFDENVAEATIQASAPKKAWDEELRHKILVSMEEAKLYLEPELTLASLAKRLNVSNTQVSYTINTAFDKNFNEFVNGYRIEHFKKEVAKPENENITLLGIAYDCGFNSKATFNRVFKKEEGISPKEYLEKSAAV
jgi:AraC-like DNA-binding protein